MKTLFIYYSHTGSGDVVADYLSERGVEVRKVLPVKPLPKSFVGAILKGGFLATIGYKSPLRDYDPSLEGYDRVIIGSPVWNARFSTPINAVLAVTDLSGVDLSFVLYAGGGTAPKALDRIAKRYPDAKAVVLKQPKDNADELAKLDSLI